MLQKNIFVERKDMVNKEIIENGFFKIEKKLNEEFIGDYNDEEIIDIYNKLFYGSNLELLKNEEYHPSFNVDEKHKCWEIFESGLSILNKYLNDDFSMK